MQHVRNLLTKHKLTPTKKPEHSFLRRLMYKVYEPIEGFRYSVTIMIGINTSIMIAYYVAFYFLIIIEIMEHEGLKAGAFVEAYRKEMNNSQPASGVQLGKDDIGIFQNFSGNFNSTSVEAKFWVR